MRNPFKLLDRLASFGFAWRGLRTLLAEEHNARLHLVVSLAAAIIGASVFLPHIIRMATA